MKLIVISIFFFTFVNAIPINNDTDVGPNMEAVNTYLYGEPNPEWLKYVNEDGVFDPSLVDPKHPVKSSSRFYWPSASYETLIIFYLYTQKEPEKREILSLSINSESINLESIKLSTFDPNNPIIFLIHGWKHNEESSMIQKIKNAYIAKADFNVIAVDWSRGASSEYLVSRTCVQSIAVVLARFIEFLVQNMGVKTSQIQIVGHSLGAHVAGLTGKYFASQKLAVIVGLDPALPLFWFTKPENRLDATDAEYVEVIHTNGGFLGFDEPIGTADFYPNYGRRQPGCGIDLAGTCAHRRAYEYFAESILTDVGFWSHQCGDYSTEIKKKKCNPTGEITTLGGNPLQKTRAIGNYHLYTHSESPFAFGRYRF